MNLRQGCSSPQVIHRNVIRDRIQGVANAYEQQQKRRPRHCKQRLTEIIQNQVPDAEGKLISSLCSERQCNSRAAERKTSTFSLRQIRVSTTCARRHAITTAKYATAM